jgi:sporulation-control protein spo0M
MANIVTLLKELQSTVGILTAKVDKNLFKDMQMQASDIRNHATNI